MVSGFNALRIIFEFSHQCFAGCVKSRLYIAHIYCTSVTPGLCGPAILNIAVFYRASRYIHPIFYLCVIVVLIFSLIETFFCSLLFCVAAKLIKFLFMYKNLSVQVYLNVSVSFLYNCFGCN